MPLSPYMKNIRSKVGDELLMVPAVGVVIVNSQGEVLLQQRADNGQWGLPGGMMDPGETPEETAHREVYEETGLHIELERVVGVYAGTEFISTHISGSVNAIVSILFRARPVDEAQEPQALDDESLALVWFSPDALPEMPKRHVIRIRHALSNQREAYYKLD